MRGYFNFKCETCGEVSEDFIENTVEEVKCVCGGKSVKSICYGMATVKADGTDPNNVRAWDKWARVREQRAKQVAKQNS